MAYECIVTFIYNFHITIYTEEEDCKLSSQKFPMEIPKSSSQSRKKAAHYIPFEHTYFYSQNMHQGISDTLVKPCVRYFPGTNSDYSDRFHEDASELRHKYTKSLFHWFTHTQNKEKKYIIFSLAKLSYTTGV